MFKYPDPDLRDDPLPQPWQGIREIVDDIFENAMDVVYRNAKQPSMVSAHALRHCVPSATLRAPLDSGRRRGAGLQLGAGIPEGRSDDEQSEHPEEEEEDGGGGGGDAGVSHLTATKDGHWAFVASTVGEIQVWEVWTRQLKTVLRVFPKEEQAQEVTALAVCELDDNALRIVVSARCGERVSTVMWQLQLVSGDALEVWRTDRCASQLQLSVEGSYLAAVWQPTEEGCEAEVFQLPAPTDVSAQPGSSFTLSQSTSKADATDREPESLFKVESASAQTATLFFLRAFVERHIGHPAQQVTHAVLLHWEGDHRLVRYDIAEKTEHCMEWFMPGAVTCVALDSATCRAVVGLDNGGVAVVNTVLGTLAYARERHHERVTGVAFQGQEHVVACAADRRVHIYAIDRDWGTTAGVRASKQVLVLLSRSPPFPSSLSGPPVCHEEVALAFVPSGKRLFCVDIKSGKAIVLLQICEDDEEDEEDDGERVQLMAKGEHLIVVPASSVFVEAFVLDHVIRAAYPSIDAACRRSNFNPKLAKRLFAASTHAERNLPGAFEDVESGQQDDAEFAGLLPGWSILKSNEDKNKQAPKLDDALDGPVEADSILRFYNDLSRPVYNQLRKREDTRQERIARMERRRGEIEAQLKG